MACVKSFTQEERMADNPASGIRAAIIQQLFDVAFIERKRLGEKYAINVKLPACCPADLQFDGAADGCAVRVLGRIGVKATAARRATQRCIAAPSTR
jgi:hypothetical protein